MATTALWRDYLALCKPKVVLLMIITSIVGMCLSTHGFPWRALLWGNLGIALSAGAAATINHVLDVRFDRRMKRTEKRPVVQGRVTPLQALIFAGILCSLSMVMLVVNVNVLTAILTFITLIGYAVIYTAFLKHMTVQNIVIGGAAGAAPPLLGWVAVTGHVDLGAWILMGIIFMWTPPHFWALAIHRVDDYAKANIPMLPNRYGIPFTKRSILIYTILLAVVTLLPFMIKMSGWVYLVSATFLNIGFLYYAIRLYRSDDERLPMKTFRYSILYLLLLFRCVNHRVSLITDIHQLMKFLIGLFMRFRIFHHRLNFIIR